MKKIMLCGRPDGVCCPHIEEDTKDDVIHIVDKDQIISFNKRQQRELLEYLCKKQGCSCKVCPCQTH